MIRYTSRSEYEGPVTGVYWWWFGGRGGIIESLTMIEVRNSVSHPLDPDG